MPMAESMGGVVMPAEEGTPELAGCPRILDCFVEDLHRLGVVGEDRLAKLAFLTGNSRFLDRPLSVVVKGPSSAGKSFTVETTLKFFPEHAFIRRTAMSPRALVHTEEDFAHRILVIAEAAGIQGETGDLLLRSLLSEGCLQYETVEKTDGGQFKSRLIKKKGPTGVIITTTAIHLHPENETRIISVPVDDTPEHTREVFRAIASRERELVSDSSLLQPWHDLHRWLERGVHKVVVPFADELAESIPPSATRLRRDFTSLLSVIKANALLHQANRKKVNGAVMATLDDYRVAFELLSDLLAEVVEQTISQNVREVVKAVGELLRETRAGHVSQRQLASRLGLDKSTVSRRVAQAIDGGFLRNEERRDGMPARLAPGDPLPTDEGVLPTPEALERFINRCTVAPDSKCNEEAQQGVMEERLRPQPKEGGS